MVRPPFSKECRYRSHQRKEYMFGRECWEVLAGVSSVPVEGLIGESSLEESLKEAELKSLCPESVAFSSSGPSTLQNTNVSDRIEEAIEGVKDDEERHLMKYLAKKQYLGHLMFMGEMYQKID